MRGWHSPWIRTGVVGIIVAWCFGAQTIALAADPRAILKRDVATAAAAWNRQNYSAFVQWLTPRIVRGPKDRTRAIAEIKSDYIYLGGLGLRTVTVKPEEPRPIERHGAIHTSVVPFVATIDGPSGTVVARSYLLAESRDGAHWRILPLVKESEESVNRLFPEYGGAFRFPESTILRTDPKVGALLGL